MVEKLDGCYFNVMGLPIYRLSALLEKEGFTMLSWMKQEK
jgi:septum formation protein